MTCINEGSHNIALHVTRTFIHKWNEPYLPVLPSRRASPIFGSVLISRPAEGRRLSWPGIFFCVVSILTYPQILLWVTLRFTAHHLVSVLLIAPVWFLQNIPSRKQEITFQNFTRPGGVAKNFFSKKVQFHWNWRRNFHLDSRAKP